VENVWNEKDGFTVELANEQEGKWAKQQMVRLTLEL
jgi:hypothetical protein